MTERSEQTLLWQQRSNQQLFAELCNALYERELAQIATCSDMDILQLQKRLGSLPYYIKRAAEHICQLTTPLELDSQNGSWLHPQAVKPFAVKAQVDKTLNFFQRHSQMALVVPVAVEHSGIEQIVLDSIDDIDMAAQRLHCNQQGWFEMTGQAITTTPLVKKTLLKPSKAVMAAACCGHQWLNGKRRTARRLALREMLLATQINWRQFAKLLPIKK